MRSGRIYVIAVAAIIIIFASGRGLAAEKLRLAYVSPSLPAPNDKALQAVLERETDPKLKSSSPADFIDGSFFRDIEKSGMIEQLYRK